jgi:hypothetical protein
MLFCYVRLQVYSVKITSIANLQQQTDGCQFITADMQQKFET